MSTTVKRILLGLCGLFVLLQFFQIDKSNPTAPESESLAAVMAPPADVSQLLEQACYDCHSNETKYPWYANIQPVGWWLKGHINEGREHLNFSTWAAYNAEKQAHKAEETAEEVEEEHMPIKPYLLTHPEARLSEAQRERLITWFAAIAHGSDKDISEKIRERLPKDQLPAAPQDTEAE